MGDRFIITHEGDRVTVRFLGADIALTPDEALDLGAQLTAASLEAFKAHRDTFETKVESQIEEFVSELEGVGTVGSEVTFIPPWTPEKMSA